MPATVVKSDASKYKKLSLKKTESKWKKAKKAAGSQGHKENWPYVQHIYQKMLEMMHGVFSIDYSII